MKTLKMILSAALATMTFAACNKDMNPQSGEAGLKTIEISLADLAFTKAETDAFLTSDNAVVLNNFKIFLTDGIDIIEPGFGATTVQNYYSVAEGESLPKSVTIDYVPNAVNKVVVVGNVSESTWGDGITKYADLVAQEISIDDQWNYKNLALYGESSLEPAGTQHNHEGEAYNLYKASVSLAPFVARFEIDGFALEFNSDPAKFDKVEVKQIAIDNYYTKTTLNPLSASTLKTSVTTLDDVSIFSYFTDNITTTGWYYDALGSGEVVLDRANAVGTPLVAKADMTSKKAYHFFPGTENPRLFIQLSTTSNGVETPSYIYSKGFKKADGSSVEFKPGYVYRMNFEGTAADGDGDLKFDEDDINQLEKCLEITVEVVKWNVEIIKTEF